MNKDRPVNLAITTLSFPPMAIVSILHRLSGVFLILLVPFVLCLLHCSLESAAMFHKVKMALSSVGGKCLTWLSLCALIGHLLAGFRHMMMDLGVGEHLHSARRSALILLFIMLIVAVCLGIWLW